MAGGQPAGLASFKAYDIRGRVPDELDRELAYKVGRAYARFVGPKRVVVGHDIRLSSPEIAGALIDGLNAAGVDVVDIGQCGTEQVYFSTFQLKLDGGIMVTASHNPKDYNGLKLVREQARPISSDTGLLEMQRMILDDELGPEPGGGRTTSADDSAAFVDHLTGYVDTGALEPLTIVVNAGNGGAGRIVDLLEPRLPFRFVKLGHEPDGTFPNGVPNPLLQENRETTSRAVRESGADFGVAWDGDFDRCFLFDEKGSFIEGYYIVGLLAASILAKNPGARVVHDPRLTWNTIEVVREAGGVPIQSKSGHAFVKQVMREQDAVYGGEMSAHHFFRDFSYCDSGMVPWLLVAELICRAQRPLSGLVGERMQRYPASGEINRRLADPAGALDRVRRHYSRDALRVDETDGIGLDFERWRFNLRLSNTEPLIRLNVESRGDPALMRAKTDEVLALLEE
ncbi:MAG TPA: phosphomannomutase CpsG [Candidatus Polarisedimenticolaceae bacterium]|nr:phosphomannomutase CpsG [Candidatus Polarisedimenticolaceae bacterium]